MRQEFDLAIPELNRALQLNPNSVTDLFLAAWGKSLCGLTHEAKQHAELGLRLSPKDFDLWLGVAYLALAQASFAEENFEEAKKWGRLSIQMHARAPIRRSLMIACCAFSGDLEEAKQHATTLDSFAPNFIDNLLDGTVAFYKQPQHNELLVKGLRDAGIEENR